MEQTNQTELSVEEMSQLLDYSANLTPQWLAGFFDGEGCISSNFDKNSELHHIRVSIAQKNPIVLVLISLKFPTKIYSFKHKKGNIWHELRWVGRTAKPILEYIKDSLTIKRQQAILALEFIETLSERDTFRNTVSLSDRERRKEIYEQLKKLNGEF
jgi:LAGLIDADG endonuclease